MKNGNWGYLPDYSHQNYTQRFHRQSRITGQWSENRKADRIPKSAWFGATIVFVTFILANFI
jgi:hypothetical protein